VSQLLALRSQDTDILLENLAPGSNMAILSQAFRNPGERLLQSWYGRLAAMVSAKCSSRFCRDDYDRTTEHNKIHVDSVLI
jgi:hypothetical protein